METTFWDFIGMVKENGNFHNEEIISMILPLLNSIQEFHDEGKVAILNKEKSIIIRSGKLDIEENFSKEIMWNFGVILKISPKKYETIEISEEYKEINEVGSGKIDSEKSNIHKGKSSDIIRPVFVEGYESFEMRLGHHDPISDIFVCGLILASLSLGLDFNDPNDLELFVEYRNKLHRLRDDIHPVIANIIIESTDLDRSKRPRDLSEIIIKLENYREYNPEENIDITTTEGFIKQEVSSRKNWILHKLKSRLFDISRRNKLLYFKSNMRFLNFTISSVPNLLDYKNINPDNLFVWNDKISNRIIQGKEIPLNKYLRFEDNPYIKSSLDKIRSEARKDINEYGFSQLRLVIAFLDWYNVKEDKNEKIKSPLLLIPVDIIKKKGVEDQYVMSIKSNQAEVNPLLIYYFKELYGMDLPDFINLSEISINEFYEFLRSQIASNKSGIELVLLDKPKIKLIHTIAKRTLSGFNKRRRRRKGLIIPSNFQYSYDKNEFIPLGLQIYKEKIKPYVSYLEYLINDEIKIESFSAVDEYTKRTMFSTNIDDDANPFRWVMDTCNITLGNFNYKKMTLVRDFNEIINKNIQNDIFDNLFSEQPVRVSDITKESNKLIQSHYNIIESDPSQTTAINLASDNQGPQSYIIQGPPGTGKSQTITNLVADFIARDKKVLFVCEMRAAIDVVYHRLKQKGLDKLCTRIHDSQGDKKDFIMNLKETYFDFIDNPIDFEKIERKRDELILNIEKEIVLIEDFHDKMATSDVNAGVSTRNLLERLVILNNAKELVSGNLESVPSYREWVKTGSIIEELYSILESYGFSSYKSSPLSKLSDDILLSDKPLTEIESLLAKFDLLVDDINEDIDNLPIASSLPRNVKELKSILEESGDLYFLTSNNNIRLLEEESDEQNELNNLEREYRLLYNKLTDISQSNSNWITKMSEVDVINALKQMDGFENSFLSILSPKYWKLKKIIETHYDFSKHIIKPKFTQVLKLLKTEYELQNEKRKIELKSKELYNNDDILAIGDKVNLLINAKDNIILNFIKSNPNEARQLLNDMSDLNLRLGGLFLILEKILNDYPKFSLEEIEEKATKLKGFLPKIHEILPQLKEIYANSKPLFDFIKENDYSSNGIEFMLAIKSLEDVYNKNREFREVSGLSVEAVIKKISRLYSELLEVNSTYIQAKIQSGFIHNILLSEQSNSVLDAYQRLQKKKLKAGRKILEREFNKKMRYRSIRDIASSEAGELVKNIKPVWLMSPLSVSDTLPIDSNYFDVVIFDEASQINLEEGIPPFFRAKKTIIVGDEMQMPPTNFFNTTISEVDDLETEEEEKLGVFLDADSLLTQGARKMSSVMLKWHYRSKHETLISFSNAAFYGRNLMTIPDKKSFNTEEREFLANNPEDAIDVSNSFLDRSISYHFMKNAIYEKRSNLVEAEYIAYMVRELIRKEPDLSIGVVAFSQQQQSTIESALIDLAARDKVFENELENEYQKMDNDQFIGLFVKNLENVQGDERDIIIMSVCYGFNRRGKMLMNFGPINRKGGEKRLNVIFSRAKKHMAIVSSIYHTDIKNEYNEGANYFKRFLQYSESVSRGLKENANSILNSLTIFDDKKSEKSLDVVVIAINDFLVNRGYKTELNVGHSKFICNIAVKKTEEESDFSLGILIDTEEHYQNYNVFEQYHQRPAVLRSFGWNILQVYIKDWYKDRKEIEERIVKLLEGIEEIEEVDETGEVESIDKGSKIEKNEEGLEFECFELTNEKSNKFWEIAVKDNLLVTRYGRIGSNARINEKRFDSDEKALIEKNRLIKVKINKGYMPD